MFIALSSTCIQNFSNRHSPSVILSHSVAVAEGSGIQHVEPPDDSILTFFFITCYAAATFPLSPPLTPEQHFFYFRRLGSWKNIL